jgi:hypothetical protein
MTMADSLNTTNLSRRTILGTGIAAAGALSVSPLPGSAGEADHELTALYAQHRAQERLMLDAVEVADEAEYAARGQFPKPPDSLIWRHSDGTPHYNNGGDPMVMTSTLFNPEDLPNDVQADLLAYESACDAIRGKHNCAALRQVADELEEENSRLWEAIAETPSRSWQGVAIKIGLGISSCMETSMQAGARADAMRLAGFPDDFGEQ